MTATQTTKSQCEEATCTKKITHIVRNEDTGRVDFRFCNGHANVAASVGYGYVERIGS